MCARESEALRERKIEEEISVTMSVWACVCEREKETYWPLKRN